MFSKQNWLCPSGIFLVLRVSVEVIQTPPRGQASLMSVSFWNPRRRGRFYLMIGSAYSHPAVLWGPNSFPAIPAHALIYCLKSKAQHGNRPAESCVYMSILKCDSASVKKTKHIPLMQISLPGPRMPLLLLSAPVSQLSGGCVEEGGRRVKRERGR